MDRDGSGRMLLTGMLISLAVHAALAAAVVRNAHLTEAMHRGDDQDWTRATVLLEPDEPEIVEPPERLRLGLDQGDPDATAWLGFEDETEHHARQGVEDQSAMVLEETAGLDDDPAHAGDAHPGTAAEEAMIEAQPRPDVHVDDRAAEPRQSETIARAADAVAHWTADVREAAQRLAGALSEAVHETLLVEQTFDPAAEEIAAAEMDSSQPPAVEPDNSEPSAVEPIDAQMPTAQADPDEPSPHTPTPAPTTPGSAGEHGIVTDRESIATSIRHAPAVSLVNGRVRAAEGLELLTRRPRWTFSTMATRRPTNPTVEITFDSAGQVKRARFATDGITIYNTGYDDVDQPLLNAIYGWTARGRAIDELAPDGEVRIFLTVILR